MMENKMIQQTNRKQKIPTGLKVEEPSFIMYYVIISEGGFVKYASSDQVHAMRFNSQWGGLMFKVKEYGVENAKTKALQAWRGGMRETTL
jgi:hypothetical protein